jgi:hypothetical protein
LLKHPGSARCEKLGSALIAHKEDFSGEGPVVSYLKKEGDNLFFKRQRRQP